MRSVGIDIGSYSIKVVEVQLGKRGLKVTRFSDHTLGQNPAFDPDLEILEFLKSLAQSYDPADTKFCIGLRQENVSSRFWNIPFSDRNKILKLLPNELEEELPLSADSAIYDFKTVCYQGSATDLIAAATPKHRIESLLNVFRSAGIDPAIVSSEGFALANCYEKWSELPPNKMGSELEITKVGTQMVIQVHIGHTRTQVLAYDQERLVNVRTIYWGVKNIAEAIARKYELPYIEGLREMQNKAFLLLTKEGASYDQIVFSETISGQIRDLARDLNITLLELRSQFNANIAQILLSGGGSSILNLNAFLTQQLEAPVNKMQVLHNFPNIGFEKNPKIEGSIGVALGLALEGLKKPRSPAINFLKGEFAPQNLGIQKFFAAWGPPLRVATAFFFLFLAYSLARQTVSFDLADKTAQALKTQALSVAHLDKKQANDSGVKKYISEQKKKIDERKKIAKVSKMNSALDIFKKVSEASPGRNSIQLEVRRFLVEEERVRLEGFIGNSQQLMMLQNALVNLAVGGKVDPLTSPLPAPPGFQSFALEFKVDRGIE